MNPPRNPIRIPVPMSIGMIDFSRAITEMIPIKNDPERLMMKVLHGNVDAPILLIRSPKKYLEKTPSNPKNPTDSSCTDISN